MENKYSRGDDQWPHTMVKAHHILITWKSDKPCISPCLSAIIYTNLDSRSQKKTSGQKTAPYNPNCICHLCGSKGHCHIEWPKNNEWDKFRHSSRYQIEFDGKKEDNTATTILAVTESTGLGDMAKYVINNISITDPKCAFNMFHTMIYDEKVSASQTSESKQDNSFIGFQNIINSCPHFSAEAFNLNGTSSVTNRTPR